MGMRRRSREMALQALFYMDSRQNISLESFDLYCKCFSPPEKLFPFFERLTKGVMRNFRQIDKVIEQFSSNWKINRMSCVDRNILRMAIYEILFCEDIPEKVSINEAIDIGKKYGTEDSGAFINGILDSVRLAIRKGDISSLSESSDPIPERIISQNPSLINKNDIEKTVKILKVRGRPNVVKRRLPDKNNLTTDKE